MSRKQQLENEILSLRKLLKEKEDELEKLTYYEDLLDNKSERTNFSDTLPKWAVERYSRQLLVTELAAPAQTIKRLLEANVLIVGAGGLGCPAAGYLTGAGIGHIGIIDYDDVEITNIHRQLLHSEMSVGMSKVESAALSLQKINSHVKVTPYNILLDSTNALDIIKEYDVVLDATDNVVTRYLLNDACVLSGKPLVTASALKMEGQLTIYNHATPDTESSGVCMRCIFPIPPPASAVGSCSQQGVLGPIPGIMGTLQALETIKLLVGAQTIAGSMLLFDGMESSFRIVKLRGKNPKCNICSPSRTITQLIDYTVFCNAQPSDKDLKLNILSEDERISPKSFNENTYNTINKSIACGRLPNDFDFSSCGEKLLIDVRSIGEYEMCKIPGSINVPIDVVEGKTEQIVKSLSESPVTEVYFLCRRGNDSQIAVKEVQDMYDKLFPAQKKPLIRDISGGLHEWSKEVDPTFPVY